MKRVVIAHFGGPEVLEVVEDADPRPSPKSKVRDAKLITGFANERQ
jgi:hypothetical protein